MRGDAALVAVTEAPASTAYQDPKWYCSGTNNAGDSLSTTDQDGDVPETILPIQPHRPGSMIQSQSIGLRNDCRADAVNAVAMR